MGKFDYAHLILPQRNRIRQQGVNFPGQGQIRFPQKFDLRQHLQTHCPAHIQIAQSFFKPVVFAISGHVFLVSAVHLLKILHNGMKDFEKMGNRSSPFSGITVYSQRELYNLWLHVWASIHG